MRQYLRIVKDDPYNKICRLLDFTDKPGNIDAPGHAGEFDLTYELVDKGCDALPDRLKKIARFHDARRAENDL